MKEHQIKWFYLIVLSIIWGSSFILIKKGLVGFSPLQLGAVRTIMAGIILFALGWKSVFKIPAKTWKWVILGGFLGTFFPAFLFAYAETEIDSAVASILNSTVPLLTLILGFVAFGISFTRNQVFGVIVGLTGSTGLIVSGAMLNTDQNYFYAGLVLLASMMYAINVNLIKRHLQDLGTWSIATGNFAAIMIPSIGILWWSGFFDLDLMNDDKVKTSLGYIFILALFGTAAAKIMFNRLVQISTPVFSSSVTYTMPVVGLMWGILDGEIFGVWQLASATVIILGVILVTRK